MSEIYLIPDENNVFHQVDEKDIYDMENPIKALTKAYQQGCNSATEKFIEALDEIYDYVWDRDIPSSTCPEYKEHHEDCIEIMSKIKDKKRELLESMNE